MGSSLVWDLGLGPWWRCLQPCSELSGHTTTLLRTTLPLSRHQVAPFLTGPCWCAILASPTLLTTGQDRLLRLPSDPQGQTGSQQQRSQLKHIPGQGRLQFLQKGWFSQISRYLETQQELADTAHTSAVVCTNPVAQAADKLLTVGWSVGQEAGLCPPLLLVP